MDRDTFDGVTALLTSPSRNYGDGGRKYLLSGLAVCGKCGNTLGSEIQRGQPRYKCKHCHGGGTQIENVDKFVLDVVAERLSREDAADLLLAGVTPLICRRCGPRPPRSGAAAGMGSCTDCRKDDAAQMIAFNENVDAQLAEIKSQTQDDRKARMLEDVGHAGSTEAVLAGSRVMTGPPARNYRHVVTVTVLPGQTRGPLRTDLLPITWKE